MKKMLCLVLCLLLAMGALPVSADVAESALVEKLILTAKEKLSVDDAVMEFSRYYVNETDEGNLYNLYWTAKDKNTYRNISAVLDSRGEIVEYYLYEDKGDSTPSFAKFSREEAAEAARIFAASLAPDKLALTELLPVERARYGEYQIVFQRMHEGIPVKGNRLSCAVDCNTLQIVSYHASWEEMSFPEGEPISEEAARQAFCDDIGYELFYQIVSQDYENTARLVYKSRYDETVFIDAFSGEAVSYDELMELYRNTAAVKEEAAMSDSMGGVSLSPEEQALVDKVSAMLSKEKADGIARSVPEFDITADFSLEDYSVSRQNTGEYAIFLRYRREAGDEEKGYAYKSLTLEAESGKVLGYSSYDYSADIRQEEQQEIPKEELEKKAIVFLEKYYAGEYAQMVKKEYFGEAGSGFDFLRTVDGVKVYNNGASLRFDAVSGKLTSFSLDWTEVAFPAKNDADDLAAANQAAMEKGGFALGYMTVKEGEEKQTVLVYGLETKPVLDAVTLGELDYRLRPVAEEEVPVYTDLSGHYAEERIEKLSDHGIYLAADGEGRLLPEEGISQMDYLLLLDKLIWNGRYAADTEELYRYVVRQGILTQDEVAPEAAVSRLSAVRWLLSAMDYGRFVNIPGIFRCPFADVTEQDAGVATVAWGLKLVSGDGENFYPDSSLRRADALIILYNYLQK